MTPIGTRTGPALDWLTAFVERRAATAGQQCLLQLLVAEGTEQAAGLPGGLPAAEIPLLVYGAAGGEGPPPLPLAGCCLCVYLGADVVDNVLDRELSARWADHGPSLAILAGGTFLSALASAALAELDVPPRRRSALQDALVAALLAMTAGQAADVASDGRADVTLAACEEMVQGKSGAEWAFFAQAGALLAGAEADVCATYATFGRELGTTCQLLSDCADLGSRDGAVSRDLAAGKRTLPVIYALTTLPDAARADLLADLAAAPRDPARKSVVVRRLAEVGAFHYGALVADVHRRRALAALDRARPAGAAGEALRDLVEAFAVPRRPAK